MKKTIMAITAFPRPTNVSEMRKFHRLLQCLHKFIPDLQHMMRSSQELLKKDVPWIWTSQMEEDFKMIKRAISLNISVKQFNSNWKTKIFIDFSKYGLRYALIQVDPDNKENQALILCDSTSKTEAQSRLPALYRENLCLAWALNSLDYYLRGSKKFQVFSDHQALCSLYNKAQLYDLSDEIEILCRQTLKILLAQN